MNATLDAVTNHAKNFPSALGGGINAVVVFAGDEVTVDQKAGRREKLIGKPQIEFYADRPGGSQHGDFLRRFEIDGLAAVAKNLSRQAMIMPGVDGNLLAQIIQWAQQHRAEMAKRPTDDAGKRTAQP